MHPTCSATDLLILLVSFAPGCMLHLWMFWLCIILLWYYSIDLYIASTPLSTMSTGYFHSPHLPVCSCWFYIVLLCIIELYWLVLLTCIIVIAYIPQTSVSTGFTLLLTCLLVCLYFSCRKDDLFVLPLCIIACILTLTFVVVHLSASTIVEGSRPCPHPYNIF